MVNLLQRFLNVQGNDTRNLFTVGGADADNGSTYIGGAGTDTFTTAKGLLAVNGTFDTVLTGGAGNDTVVISDTNAGTIADSIFTNVSGMEAITFKNTDTSFDFTSGGLFNAAFSTGVTVTAADIGANATATIDLSVYNKSATINVTTGSDDDATVVKGGSAADVITVNAAAYTGGAGDMAVYGGAGNDTITVNTIATGDSNDGVIVITGGTGADNIVVTTGAQAKANLITFVVGAGDSTTTAWDTIQGFHLARATGDLQSDFLDFAGTATVAANTASAQAASGYTNVTFTITSGLLAFQGTGASSLALADKVAIANQAAAVNLSSVVFVDGANSYVFNQNSTADSLVQLSLVSATGLTTTNSDDTTGYVYIS